MPPRPPLPSTPRHHPSFRRKPEPRSRALRAVIHPPPAKPRKMTISSQPAAQPPVHAAFTARHPKSACLCASRPRQDFSSQVKGAMLGDLFHNFNSAWKKEDGMAIMGQILRTQPQYGIRHIKEGYLQAVSKASQYIYIENQYFRWTPLAEKIKESAQGQTGNGRKPEIHGPLYLFVITNADKEGMGAGVKNTARMLESLGRGDALPEGVRQQYAEDTEAELASAKQQSAEEQSIQHGIASNTRTGNFRELQSAKQRLEDSKQRQAAADQRAVELKNKRDAQRKEQESAKENRQVIKPKEIPGLKVHVCTLVAPDSPGRSGSTASTKDRALTREERIAKTEKELDEANAKVLDLRMQRNQELLGDAQRPTGAAPSRALPDLDQRLQTEEKKRNDLRQELKDLKDAGNPIDWVDVYIHAKLMIIDDTFMTLGSANINSRSMETDSELNIIHANHLISHPARKALWEMHTKSRSSGEVMDMNGMEKAYNAWDKLMNKNKYLRFKKFSPAASLVKFFSGTESRSDLD